MIRGLGIPASAIQAAQDRLAATANNVANVQSTGLGRERVDLAAAAVQAGVTSTHRVMDPAGSSLVDDMADMSITAGLYTANAAVIRTQDETTKSVLDIFA
jgi:flagellar basal-body rod protein FlgC